MATLFIDSQVGNSRELRVNLAAKSLTSAVVGHNDIMCLFLI